MSEGRALVPGPWRLRAAQGLTAALGIAGPLAVGSALGRGPVGAAVAFGGLALSGTGAGGAAWRERAAGLGYAIGAGSAAMAVGALLAEHRIGTALALPLLGAAAALIGGATRPLARATAQFLLFTTLATHLAAPSPHRAALPLLFCVGAALTAAIGALLRRALRVEAAPAAGPPEAAPPGETSAAVAPPRAPAPPRPTWRQVLRRWRWSLGYLAGWQYALRLTLCLAAASAYEFLWPGHHAYWVSLTLVLVVQRDLQAARTRTLERAGGTLLGVLATSVLLLGPVPLWARLALIAACAGARPLLRESHYTAYAAVMTPLVLLLLDYGQEPSAQALVDRLAATLTGCGLALTLGYVGWSRVKPLPWLPRRTGEDYGLRKADSPSERT